MSEQTTPPTNDIIAMRSVLFDTLRALSDKDKPMDIERAAAIKDVAQVIINSAKVEVDALKIIGGTGSGFIPALPPPKPETKSALSGTTHPQHGMTVHRMRG
jgi:hypothetical protein